MPLSEIDTCGVVGLQQRHLPVQRRQGGTGDRNGEGDGQGLGITGAPAAGTQGRTGSSPPLRAQLPLPLWGSPSPSCWRSSTPSITPAHAPPATSAPRAGVCAAAAAAPVGKSPRCRPVHPPAFRQCGGSTGAAGCSTLRLSGPPETAAPQSFGRQSGKSPARCELIGGRWPCPMAVPFTEYQRACRSKRWCIRSGSPTGTTS
jgi:hypothetical protein